MSGALRCPRCGSRRLTRVGDYRWTAPPGPVWVQWQCEACKKLVVTEEPRRPSR